LVQSFRLEISTKKQLYSIEIGNSNHKKLVKPHFNPTKDRTAEQFFSVINRSPQLAVVALIFYNNYGDFSEIRLNLQFDNVCFTFMRIRTSD